MGVPLTATLARNSWLDFWGVLYPDLDPGFFRVATYLEKLEKAGNLTLVMEKSRKFWFACGVLLMQL